MKPFDFSDHKFCPDCKGSGKFGNPVKFNCCHCNGSGEVPKSNDELRAEGLTLFAELISRFGIIKFVNAVAKYAEEQARPEIKFEKEMLTVLKGLKNSECYCDVGIDNPMFHGQHSRECLRASALEKCLTEYLK